MGSTPECKIKKQLIKIFLHPPHLHARKERKPITTLVVIGLSPGSISSALTSLVYVRSVGSFLKTAANNRGLSFANFRIISNCLSAENYNLTKTIKKKNQLRTVKLFLCTCHSIPLRFTIQQHSVYHYYCYLSSLKPCKKQKQNQRDQ